MAPAIRKRVSKKLKKSWRKNVDISDVENFLEDKRLEERLGTPFAERKDEELYCIDKEKTEIVEEKKQKSKRQCREELKNKPFKSYEILTARSCVPDPMIKRNRVRTPEERKSALSKKIEADRQSRGILKKKEIVALRDRALARIRRRNVPKQGEFKRDLWNADDQVGEEWLSPTTVANLVKNTRRFQKPPPKSVLNKPSVLGAIDIPHPGMSYNPSYAEHQALLKKIVDTELEIMKEERHLERVTTHMFSKVTRKQEMANWLSEMSEGLPCSEKLEVKDERDDDTEYRAINPPVQNRKKTLKKRRKLKEAKKDEQARLQTKVEKKKISDIYQLKFLEDQLKALETKLEMLHARRKKAKELRELAPKKLSKKKFEPLEMEFNLPSELSGNLRSVLPQGNVLTSRFYSLQMRNIIEPGSKHVRKRAKMKRFTKSSHKLEVQQ